MNWNTDGNGIDPRGRGWVGEQVHAFYSISLRTLQLYRPHNNTKQEDIEEEEKMESWKGVYNAYQRL